MDRVFNNELLLDNIIGYAIQEKRDLRSCRVASKIWLQSVSRVLLKSRKPLFRIFLSSDGFSIGSSIYRQWNENPDEILRTTVGRHQQEDHAGVPPHSIMVLPTSIHNAASYQMFLDCLTYCGSSLVQLELPLLDDPTPVPVNENGFLLPRLHSFQINYYTQYDRDDNDNMDRRIDYIQSILDASVNLQSLSIHVRFKIQQLPDCLAHLTFPASITKVNFDCVMNDCKLEILARNRMPNLKTLKFLVNKSPFQDGLIERILKNVRRTLKTLHVGETKLRTVSQSPTTFEFPVMEKLEEIHIETAYFALGGLFFSRMENFVPVLRHMVLTRQTHPMFRKWVENSCFHTVESLTVSLVTGDHENNGGELDTTRPLNFDLRSMEALKRAFPNLLELDITISAADPNGLVFIMEEMTNLRRLCIRALASPHVSSCHVWDSLLIGVPVESMAALRRSPGLWKEMQELYSELPSIRNLNDLHTLEVVGANPTDFGPYPLFSRASFRFAFLQMPNLNKLTRSRGFCEGALVTVEHNLDNLRTQNII